MYSGIRILRFAAFEHRTSELLEDTLLGCSIMRAVFFTDAHLFKCRTTLPDCCCIFTMALPYKQARRQHVKYAYSKAIRQIDLGAPSQVALLIYASDF